MRIGSIITVLFIGILFVLTACGTPVPATPTPAPTTPPALPTAPPVTTPATPPTQQATPRTPPLVDAQGPNEVWIPFTDYPADFPREFKPNILTVSVGTKVTWTNKDSEPHTITSSTGLFDTSFLALGESFSYTFTQRGTYEYYCTNHPQMNKGKVIVE